MIGFNYRYSPLVEDARAIVRSGRLGQISRVRTVFTASERELPVWKRDPRRGGGVLLDLASHHVDLLEFLFERPIEAVAARIQSRESEADTASVTFEMAGGLAVESFFSLASIDEDRFEVYGSTGKMSFDRYRDARPSLVEDGAAVSRWGALRGGLAAAFDPRVWRKLRAPRAEPSYRAALAAFVAAAVEGRAHRCPLALGHRALVVLAAAARSGGERVALAGGGPGTLVSRSQKEHS
jgi:predicted dehydrogenase